jgi:hypothetical protein
MTRNTIFEEVEKCLPQFRINAEWIKDKLGYPLINDLARHICEAAVDCRSEQVREGMAFLERAVGEGDDYVRDLVWEGIETLVSCESATVIRHYCGPLTTALWREHFPHE